MGLTLLVYSSLLLAVMVLGLPYWLVRMLTSGRYRAGLAGRLGRIPKGLQEACAGRNVIWLHAVSVGEVLAATQLVTELQAALPGWLIAVSTTTETGQRLARERFPSSSVFYLPLDFAVLMRRYLGVLRPRLVVLLESELWPNMIHECSKAGVPLAVVNARVSDRSFPRYMRLRRWWAPLLRKVTVFLAQSEETAGRLRAMGVSAERVRITGNLKYDVRAPRESRIAELIREEAAGRKIVVAGSTVDGKPNSEEQIFLHGAMGPVWQTYPDVLLILAPRHSYRFVEAISLARDFGTTVAASALLEDHAEVVGNNKIVLLDTLGDLAAVYQLADVAFVGGGLVKAGGHNPLEPARFGVPVVIGPSYENFREIVSKMQAADGIAVVEDEFACHKVLLDLIGRRPEARAMGERGRRVFEAEQGATARVVATLMELVR